MTVRIEPSVLRGTVDVPPSKSITHRALICAALAPGRSVIDNFYVSDDINRTAESLKALGADICVTGNSATVHGIVDGGGGCRFDCGDSASTLRFITPVALALGKDSCISGSERLMARDSQNFLRFIDGINCECERYDGGIRVYGKLRPGEYSVSANVSSQYASGLLMALPVCTGGCGESRIKLTGKANSMPYIRLTLDVTEKFGAGAFFSEDDVITVPSSGYKSTFTAIEGDCSQAAIFDIANVLGGRVKICGTYENTVQGDSVYQSFYKRIARGGAVIDISDTPDLAPALMAVGAIHGGVTLTGTGRLSEKESDRGVSMATELRKFGVECHVGDDSITVCGKIRDKEPSEPLFSHGDHRIAMVLSVLATHTGGTVLGAGAVNKSMPDFYERLCSAGADVRTIK